MKWYIVLVMRSEVPEPQLDTFVVAKCERATRPLYLDGSRQSDSFDSRNDHFQMVPGDLCICVTGHFKKN
ncbi:hypothetical protein V6Z11_A11G313900 [Gossypium hirsutum]